MFARSTVLVMGTLVLMLACRRKDDATPPSSSSATAAVSAVTAPPAPSAAAGVATGSCPEGRWEYDYSDQFLEALIRTSPGARVVSERGSFVCTFKGSASGSVVCETSAGGVENVFEAPAGGMPLK